MKRKLAYSLLAALLAMAAVVTGLTTTSRSSEAQAQAKLCIVLNGRVVAVNLPVAGALPCVKLGPVGSLVKPKSPAATTPSTTPTTPKAPTATTPKASKPPHAGGGEKQKPSTDKRKPRKPKGKSKSKEKANGGKGKSQGGGDRSKRKRRTARKTPLRNPDGSPTSSNPGFVDALPGPSTRSGVPNFVINKFRVPIFLLPIYQAAGTQYGVRWEVLAAINEIETDYGRNLNVSSAGALGWMQFIPSTWRRYGVDANKDGKKDPYNPVDAIFAAARYLKAAGYEKSVRGSIFSYNHADWYVDSVMLRARLISGVPADLVGSLTGLTEGRFPVAARARYADDLQEADARKKVKAGQNAAKVVSSDTSRKGIDIFAQKGSPVVATNDGRVKKIGTSKRLGRYMIVQDAYGNRYTYAHLGSVQRLHAVPKETLTDPKRAAHALKANDTANGTGDAKDAKPTAPASAGAQPHATKKRTPARAGGKARKASKDDDTPALVPQASAPIKQRLFAHPGLAQARQNGGLEQTLNHKPGSSGYESYTNLVKPLGLKAKDVELRPLKVGSDVVAGTQLGKVGKTTPQASHLYFEIRPAGKGAPRIDPKPILDGWKLLEATSVYRASGKNVLYGDSAGSAFSVGQVLLLPKPLLQKRVLSDPRVDIYPDGRNDIRSGQIDRRVLATLEFLAESGMRPTVSSLRGNHGLMTASGNISEHSSGNAVDIAKINGIPIVGHQDRGGITEQAVRRLMTLQGTMRPHQIISLLDFGKNTLALPDHNDHIHVGFHPLFGDNKKLGKQAFEVLKPGQWSDLLDRLRKIDNPVVPTKPSKYAIPVPKRASDAHRGD
jgi:murein DD-endopeptidase MepM/ murein hydrolase activator NlpD